VLVSKLLLSTLEPHSPEDECEFKAHTSSDDSSFHKLRTHKQERVSFTGEENEKLAIIFLSLSLPFIVVASTKENHIKVLLPSTVLQSIFDNVILYIGSLPIAKDFSLYSSSSSPLLLLCISIILYRMRCSSTEEENF
jgi:hypothetical protein